MSRSTAAALPIPTTPAQIRNVVLVGPSGGGKSTLFGRLVYGELLRRKEDEGASTSLRVATIGHEDLAITLLDTPGATDFVGEVRAALRAADAALFVIAAGGSVDEATRMLWRECAAVGMPRAVALTKLEQCQDDYATVVEACRRAFGDAQPLQVPILRGEKVIGLIDLLGAEIHGPDGEVQGAPDSEQLAVIEELRGGVVEAIIEGSEDESALDRYLSGADLDADTLREDLKAAIATARFFPIIPTHWASGVGVSELLRLFVEGFPSPADAWLPEVTTPDYDEFGEITCDPAGPLVAEVAFLAKRFNQAAQRVQTLVQSHEALLASQKSLLANASHELRSPLTRIRMGLELMGPSATPAFRDEISRNITELDQLIEEILLASRLDAREADMGTIESVDLIGMAAEEAARVDAELDMQGMATSDATAQAETELVVQGVAKLLRRSLRNLLENARRYGAGGITLSLSKTNQLAVIRVCDRGPGVPLELQERIFEPFYRLPGATERDGGVGLGLALVKSIAQRHGGRAYCENNPGGGACFVVELPLGSKRQP